MSSEAAPNWVSAALRMPVAFAQVREDPQIDLLVLRLIGRARHRCMMIASGGCTAAALVASGHLAHLHLVDANPAQMLLCQLKLDLLQTTSPKERLRILGHAPMVATDRALELQTRLAGLGAPPDALGSADIIAELGPDHAGRYELVFAELRRELSDTANQWPELLELSDASERAALIAAGTPLGQSLDLAFDRAMALPHLVQLFGTQATQNSVVPFSRHFAARTRWVIASQPTIGNPYLWQLLTGRFPPHRPYLWLSADAPKQMPEIATSISPIDRALSEHADAFDFIHLSNVLDWLSPDEARHTLELTHRALRPGGFTLIRQLNSSLNIPASGSDFDWQNVAQLHAADRSFFYRDLHLGRKR